VQPELVEAPSVQSPEISKFNLFQFLGTSRTFKIPSYQREYAWGQEQIESLCEDLREFHESGDNYYLLGQLILAKNQDQDSVLYPLAVVDGQQRLTSILLLLAALRDALQANGAVVGGGTEAGRVLQAVITGLEEIDSATGEPRLRVRLGDHGHEYMRRLFKGENLPDIDYVTTQQNIRDNFHFIESFLEKNFGLLADLADFAKKVLYKVFIIETLLEGEEQALDIFEKLNSRGLPLNSADLLKNLLFQQAKSTSYDALSKTWTSAVENVFKIKPNKAASVEYVMKSMLGARTGLGTGKKGVYKAWKEKFKNDEVTLAEFATDLEKTAKHLGVVTSSKSSTVNRDLFGCRYFGTVQHLPLVVAGMKFAKNEESHRVFCQLVEARLMTYLFSEEKTQLFEAMIWPWANKMYSLGSDPTPEAIVEASSGAFESQTMLLEQGRLHFRNYSYTSARDAKRIRFVLAEVSNALEKRALDSESNATAEEYLATKIGNTGYHLDHIFPKSAVENNLADFEGDVSWVHSPGNLALLHAQDNIAAGASDAAAKSKDYASSKLLLTKSLALESHLPGMNIRLSTAIADSRSLGNPDVKNWGQEKVRVRTEYLWTEFEKQISLEKFRLI
jgi:hypothetical protein